MDRNTALAVITAVIAIVVMIYLLIRYGIIGSATSPIVTVSYYYNGVVNSITLPSQAGTTIMFTRGINLYITGTTQPNQQITLTIYDPSGFVVYTTSVTAGPNGSFSITVPTSSFTPNVQYKIVLSLGSNYYFYAIPVSR